jgi:hypothetical protein
MVMKTQYSNEILSAVNVMKNVVYGKMGNKNLINIKWVDALLSFKFSKHDAEHYALVIAKAIIKEAIGADIEIKLLLMLVGGYFISAKDAVVHSSLIERIMKPQATAYHLPELAA